MKRILIIRPDGIGDFIIFSAVLEKYKEIYAEYQIDILCHPRVKDMAVAIPFINKIYYLNIFKLNYKKYFLYKIYILIRLNLNRYEKIIYPVYSPFKEVDELIKMIRAKEKITFDGDNSNSSINDQVVRGSIFDLIIESDKYKKLEFDRNVEFIHKLGCNSQEEFKLKLWFLPQDSLNSQKLMHQEGLIEKKYICLVPGAGAEIRYWDTKNWTNLITRLLNLYPDYKIVFLGSGSDLKPIEQILFRFQKKERIVSLYGKTNLRILAKIMENSILLIGMETGSIHMAAALNIPNVCIIGGGHFGRFYPYGDLSRNRIVYHKMDCFNCNWRCIYETSKCIKDIKTADVIKEVEILMKTQF